MPGSQEAIDRAVARALVEQDDPLFSREQAEEFLNTTERHLRRLVAERRIRYTKCGNKLRFRRSWLEDVLRENERAPVIIRTRRSKAAA